MFKKIDRLLHGFLQEFKPVTGKGCKLKARQFAEVLQLILRCQFTPDEYYFYKFYELGKDYKYMLNFLSNFYAKNYYYPVLNNRDWAPVFRNKLLFNLYFSRFKLPVTTLYGYYDRRAGFTLQGDPLTGPEELKKLLFRIKPSSLVIKPVGGEKGKNIFVLEKLDFTGTEIICRTNKDIELTFDDIVVHLQKKTPGRTYSGYLLEEKLTQHEVINSISPYALNTVRLVTFLNKDQHVDIPFSVLRLGRDGSSVDNFAQGGLFVLVNPLDGILGKGVIGSKDGSSWLNEHPDTKVVFAGMKIPFWVEVVKLCTAAAEISPFCRSIGWDVAITPHGPLLLEGNDNHAIEIQMQGNGYLQPDVRKKLARFGLVFPQNKLPKIKLRPLFQALSMWSRKDSMIDMKL